MSFLLFVSIAVLLVVDLEVRRGKRQIEGQTSLAGGVRRGRDGVADSLFQDFGHRSIEEVIVYGGD
jgi:hypothetical protein